MSASSGSIAIPRDVGDPRRRVTAQGLARVVPRAAKDSAHAFVFLLAPEAASLVVRAGFHDGVIAFDFRGTLWDPAVAILEGRSPYPEPVRSEVDVGNRRSTRLSGCFSRRP